MHGAQHCTPAPIVDAALSLLEIGPKDLLLDVGCGDGRTLIAAATKRGARGIGIEIDEERAVLARTAVQAAGADGLVRIECGNALEFDLSAANKVFLFLTDRGLRILLPRLRRMALARADAGGCCLKVCTFLYRFKDVQPVCKHRVCHPDLPSHTAYPLHLYHFDCASCSAIDSATDFGASSSMPIAPDTELRQIALPQVLPHTQLRAFLRCSHQSAFLRLLTQLCTRMDTEDTQGTQ